VIAGVLCLGAPGETWGQSAAQSESSQELSTRFASRNQRYRIQPNDVIEMSFRFTPEFNQVVTVQPDGFTPLQGAGEVKVAGLTVNEATDAILAKYVHMLHQPVVTLILKEFNKPSFVVGGHVARPGKFDFRGTVSLTDAIAMAGGFSPGARDSQVLLFRRVSSDIAEVKKVNVKRALEKGRLHEDLALQPGDAIYVSTSKLGKVDRFMSIFRMGLYFNPLQGLAW
jgi:polysaccharide export outer membrane protein